MTKKPILGLCFGLMLGVMLFYIGRSVYDYREYQNELAGELRYWKAVAGKYPEYPDGWVKLALIWDEMDEDCFAKLAIEKAERLDPINDDIRSIKIDLMSN